MRISVVGQGYVGTSISNAALDAGHEVYGVEVNAARIEELAGSRYSIESDFNVISSSEIVIIAVPTPLDASREPDLSFLRSACESIKLHISSGALLINESTSYPGTLRNFIAPIFNKELLFASAPERVDPGNEKWGVSNTPRIVAGLTPKALEKAVDFYRSICDEVVEVSSPEVAEAAKLFENTFRQVNIALVNEFAQVVSSLGISTHETLAAASTKPYGFMPFFPSIGVGGHCIPVDPSYLSYVAEQVGMNARFIKLANEVNLAMPSYIARRIDEEFGVAGKEIQVSGIAYKPGVSDTRESPALSLISQLRSMGGRVTWYDSFVVQLGNEVSTPISGVDIGIIATAHPGVDYSPWKNGTVVIDVSTGKDLGWPKYL